jgi:small nuclear ribonucleoprotein (snRNP)-like protein
MAFPKRPHQRHPTTPHHHQRNDYEDIHDLIDPEHTGSEAAWFKSLVDSRAQVTVVLTSGEQLHGRIRYYDRDCFSIGLTAKGPRFFLRKESVAQIIAE